MQTKFIFEKLQIKSQDSLLVDIRFVVENSLAIVGQSGSGKSLTLKSILNLLPKNLEVEKKLISDFEQNTDNISYVPQNPFTSLSPMTKIKDQFFAPTERQKELFELVNLEYSLLNKFPNELSGGQLQRVVIAMALLRNPKLLLLDEPTTALDGTTKNNIMNLLKTLHEEIGFKIIIVSHDIDSIKDICENIIILNKGKIIESGYTYEVLNKPKNRYTINLIESNFNNREYRI
jgi:peptide/nickel transport system ATP-binding protein